MNYPVLTTNSTADEISSALLQLRLLSRKKMKHLYGITPKLGKANFVKAILALNLPTEQLAQDYNLIVLTRQKNLEEAQTLLKEIYGWVAPLLTGVDLPPAVKGTLEKISEV